MNPNFEHLLQRAEALFTRIEAVLPQAPTAPDWTASSAFRYRKRSSGRATLEPVLTIVADERLMAELTANPNLVVAVTNG